MEHILKNVVRCKHFEAGVHTKSPINNSYPDGLVHGCFVHSFVHDC